MLIHGWISVRRDQGKMVFFDFRDRSGSVQGVVLPSSGSINVAKEVRNEYVVSVEGKVNARPEKNINAKVQNGDIELEVTGLTVLAKAEPLPFDMSADGYNLELPTELDHRALTLRHPRLQAIFKVQAVIIDSFREYMKQQDFSEFQAPAILPATAEGGAEAFETGSCSWSREPGRSFLADIVPEKRLPGSPRALIETDTGACGRPELKRAMSLGPARASIDSSRTSEKGARESCPPTGAPAALPVSEARTCERSPSSFAPTPKP